MELDINEIIKNCKERAAIFDYEAKHVRPDIYFDDTDIIEEKANEYRRQAMEQRQIMVWLEELKTLRAMMEDDLK